ncbi:MAG: endolytic transglycosylase MltG [bacterium]|nr:endolytic transglycosylase MltG [bacterium]
MSKNLKHIRLVIFGLIALTLFSFYIISRIISPQFLDGKKEIAISKGENLLEIASNLEAAGIIKSKLSFIISALYRGSHSALKAGQYVFDPGLNLRQILARIEKGEALFGYNDVVVTIPEGLTLDGIAERLEKSGFSDASNIKKIKASSLTETFDWLKYAPSKHDTLEGFLFPDTYRFSKDANAQEIAIKMLNRFDTKTKEVRNTSGKKFYDILRMASILEEEVIPSDMPIASGVLWKRLNIGMPLQVDATLVYDLGRPIKRSDIDTLNSLYNTYKNKTLPPTPISNPGLASLNAAMYPEESSYLYYLSKSSDKTTVFSATFEDHNLAKTKYLSR